MFNFRMWWQLVAFAAVGALAMAVLLPCLALVRHTTAHDWYAACKLTLTQVMLAIGFDPYSATVYRTPDGTTMRIHRFGLVVYGEPVRARAHILATAGDNAGDRRGTGTAGASGGAEQVRLRQGRSAAQRRRVEDRAGGGVAGADGGPGGGLRACGNPRTAAGGTDHAGRGRGRREPRTVCATREKVAAHIKADDDERQHGPVFRDFAGEFMRRYLVPVFGAMRVAHIARPDVARWFDSMSATPGNANRALPVLSVMLRQAELWDLRPQGSNPCRGMRRYKMKPRERFLSLDELKRLGFVLDHAEDAQAAAAIRLLLFTGARSSEITGLRWDWIRGTRALLPDSKTGPKAVQLPPPARAVLAALPRTSPFVFPDSSGDGPITNLGHRWNKLRALAGLDVGRIVVARRLVRLRLRSRLPPLLRRALIDRCWRTYSGYAIFRQ